MLPCAHITVLLHEAVEALAVQPAGCYLDGTYGRGGHSRELLARLGPQGRLLALDRDQQALDSAGATGDARFQLVQANFARMAEVARSQGFSAFDGVLLDLGISSPQIDTPERGFSFRFDAPLDMRMDTSQGETAAQFLARATPQELSKVLREDGEERFAHAIAQAVAARNAAGRPVQRTGDLAELVARVVKTHEGAQHPATRSFQALRIHVNGELAALEEGLNAALALLREGGRLVVISFHSLEDRIVKRFIARHSRSEPDRRMPHAPQPEPLLVALARVMPSEAEVAANPRSRSAVMRVAQRSAAPLRPLGARA
jgi:16S rRNA (cytosine1402-N4)-methyltransferase